MENIYQEKGYKNREDYLITLAEDYGVSYTTVKLLSEILGPSEDFDGLINSLADCNDLYDDLYESNEYFDDIDFGW